MQVAICKNRTRVLELLIQHGANIFATNGHPPLVLAAWKGRREAVELLLKCGADVHEYSRTARTVNALQAACFQGDLQTIIILLQAGARINAPARGSAGRTALQYAAERGDANLAVFLLQSGADINAPCAEEFGLSVLQAAILSGNEELVETLLRWGAVVNMDLSLKSGCSALMAAIEIGSISIFRRLLRAGADISLVVVEEPNRYCGPFLTAASGGPIEFVQILLDLGVDINTRLKNGLSLGEEAIRSTWSSRNELIRIIFKQSASIRLSHCEPDGGFVSQWDGKDIRFIQMLIDRGFDINSQNPICSKRARNKSFLQKACQCGKMEAIELLLQNGADVNLPPDGEGGETALQYACERGDLNLAKLLLQHGADVNPSPNEDGGRTALQYACAKANIDLIKVLLAHGADINAPAADYEGRTALQAATAAGNLNMVEFLVHHGADVNAPASGGWGLTALQVAAYNGYLRIAQLLLAAGADVAAPGWHDDDEEDSADEDEYKFVRNMTAINSAADWGRMDMVKLLLDHYQLKEGESLSTICEEAAVYARTASHWAVVELLETYQREPGSP